MTASPVASPAASSTPGAIFTNPEQLLNGIWLMLGFGLFAIAIVIIFILLSQNRYFGAVEYLARRGIASSPGRTEATIGGDIPVLQAVAGGGTPVPVDPILIGGPDTLTVGQPGEYSAKAANEPAPVTWTVDPAGRATVDPTNATASVKITPSAAGPLRIIATADSGTADLCVTAEKPAATPASVLGYIGAGWGSVVVAILVAAVVGALGLAKVLDGQAIAGLYGALLGYLFGVQVHAGGGASEGQSGPAGGTAGSATP